MAHGFETGGLPRRISVVGATGSGKTHLARSLADQLSLPVVELDALRWDADGNELPKEQFVSTVAALVASETWIIDGHYRATRHLIWRRADTVIWLNCSLFVIALRLLRRFAGKQLGSFRAARQFETSNSKALKREIKASWRRRLNRFARTLQERREYRHLLGSSEFSHLRVIELRSVRATRNWLRETKTKRY